MKESNTFPWKLHEMLDSVEYDRIVSWLPDGISFKVHNSSAFVRDVLPQFFLQSKYKSFQRQLNIWGFKRISDGPHKGGYTRPEHFVRGNAPLVNSMNRRKKSNFSKKAIAMIECTSSSSSRTCEDEPGPTRLSSNVSVSVDGDDHTQQLHRLGATEDLTDDGSEDDDDIFIPPPDFGTFGIPDVAFNDDEDSFVFEGNYFFPEGDDEDDPLFRPLQQELSGKDDPPKNELFIPTPISARHWQVMEFARDLDCFKAICKEKANRDVV